MDFTSFCKFLSSYHWQVFRGVPIMRTCKVVGGDIDSMRGWYRPLLPVPKAKLCSFMDLKDEPVNCVLEYCDVPSLVKVCYVTSKKFKEYVLRNLKHRSGVFAVMALGNPDLSLIQVRMLVILNDFVTRCSVPLKEGVMKQKEYDEQNPLSENIYSIYEWEDYESGDDEGKHVATVPVDYASLIFSWLLCCPPK